VTDGDVVLSLDESSGRVHKRVRLASGYATLEGCNADQSGDWRLISEEELAVLAVGARCRRCFNVVTGNK
jgi:hypothetical protein